MVGCQQDTHAAAADEDTDDLEDLVAHLEEEKGDDDDTHDGPEVEQLSGEQVGVAVRQHSEVVSLDIQKRHDEVLPAILHRSLHPRPGSLANQEDEVVDDEEQDVVEEGLEGGDVGAGDGELGAEGVGGGDAQREDLADGDDDPEVGRREVAVPVDGLGFEEVDALADGGVFGGGGCGGDGGGGGLEALRGLVGVVGHGGDGVVELAEGDVCVLGAGGRFGH